MQNRKLIEVALPLEIINRESVREKNIRHGHPSTIHLWWARRPLAACRAVIFAQLVDDPSSHSELFPTIDLQNSERQRLFAIIEKLVNWDNINDSRLLAEALSEIKKYSDGEIPSIYDPFAGGGSIPLEAQRLGLRSFASDLNPVSVLINKSLIEFPPKWQGKPPVFPSAAEAKLDWPGASGLATDVLEYGKVIQKIANEKLGSHYPQAVLEDGTLADPVAWIWARTVTCPNPACGIAMPLVRSFWLKKDAKSPIWILPEVTNKVVKYKIMHDKKGPDFEGTIGRTGGFCVACQTPVTLKYVREFGKTIGLGVQLISVVASGNRQKHYLSPTPEQEQAANVGVSDLGPSEPLPVNPRDFKTPNYGLSTFASLFSDRQNMALMNLAELVKEIQAVVHQDAKNFGLTENEASEYAKTIILYLGLAVGRSADYNSSICSWDSSRESLRNTFARQAIAMTWDFAETNIFGNATGTWSSQIHWISKVLENLGMGIPGVVTQQNATVAPYPQNVVVSTDPPYYDNIGYADLSDFFYVWLRVTLGLQFPELFVTVLTPKADELIATPYRFDGSKEAAEKFFEDGFIKTFSRIKDYHNPNIPLTVFYAFKQTEDDAQGTASTGWETMLNAILEAGFSINATWPIRTELPNRMLGSGTNALASSIVLACRPRLETAEAATRRSFLSALKSELPVALRELQEGNIAPVDLAQAAIGPGMAIFSRYTRVLEADGSDMTVRTALALINQVLDEVLSEQEGDFDPETRFCIKWFSQFGWDSSASGEADVLSRAVNTSLGVLERGGIFKAVAGKASLVEPKHMSINWDPDHDKSISIWEVALRIAHALQTEGVQKASEWSAKSSTRVDLDSVKELSYLLFSISEKKGWTESALLFNGLGTSWSEMNAQLVKMPRISSKQEQLSFEDQ